MNMIILNNASSLNFFDLKTKRLMTKDRSIFNSRVTKSYDAFVYTDRKADIQIYECFRIGWSLRMNPYGTIYFLFVSLINYMKSCLSLLRFHQHLSKLFSLPAAGFRVSRI